MKLSNVKINSRRTTIMFQQVIRANKIDKQDFASVSNVHWMFLTDLTVKLFQNYQTVDKLKQALAKHDFQIVYDPETALYATVFC